VRGVDVAVDVGFDHSVDGDDAEAADRFGMVRHLLGTQQDPPFVGFDVLVEVGRAFGRE
jgi:hypothetical protein